MDSLAATQERILSGRNLIRSGSNKPILTCCRGQAEAQDQMKPTCTLMTVVALKICVLFSYDARRPRTEWAFVPLGSTAENESHTRDRDRSGIDPLRAERQ